MPAKGDVLSIVTSSREPSRAAVFSLGRNLFDSPQPAGRKITAGFTYLQRIGKAASFDVWLPDALRRDLARVEEERTVETKDFPAQWAAVRQIELLQESGNYKIYDLDPSNLQRTMLDLSRSMRAGGYRVTVATVGRYQETSTGDELEILDNRLQERIAQMIHMLYLDEASDQANADNASRLAARKWDYRQALPHIGLALGAGDLFRPEKKHTRQHKQARQFFDILHLLPQNHIVHDTVIGLQLPELNGENEWNYIASSDETLGAFNRVLGDLFDKFNGISLSRLHEREGAGAEIKASTLHLRGYGDRLNDSSDGLYRGMALALN